MAEIQVRPLAEDDWAEYREVRLTALRDAPHAFASTHESEAELPESQWRARMVRSHRLLAERDGSALGIASVGDAGEDEPEAFELFGLWVAPEERGGGVASALVRAGARTAVAAGRRRLYYWVGTDNGPAVAFASGFGFRPTARRRPMGEAGEADGEDEIAMVLPLGGDQAFLRD